MNNFAAIPTWLGAGVIGAVVAALGYVTKLLIEILRSALETRNVRRAQLVELQALLRAAWVSAEVQEKHAIRLRSMVQNNHPQLFDNNAGFERLFSRAFSEFNQDEKDLHAIIRSITVFSIRPTNQALSNWLKNDTYFKSRKLSKKNLGELAIKLADLDAHLILWHAKYETWIPSNPEHSLVYLADEEEHGIGFPVGIDEIVRKALR